MITSLSKILAMTGVRANTRVSLCSCYGAVNCFQVVAMLFIRCFKKCFKYSCYGFLNVILA